MKVSTVALFAVGVQMLRTHPLRTVLSTLGIIIGVAALVAVLALGDGLERYSRNEIESTTDLQTIMIQPRAFDVVEGVIVRRDSVRALSVDEMDSLVAAVGGRATASETMAGTVFITGAADTTRHAAAVTAMAPATLSMPAESLGAGRLFTRPEIDADNAVLLVGRRLAVDLAGGDGAAALGREVRLADRPYAVIGIVDGAGARRVARAWLPLAATARKVLVPGSGRPPALSLHVARVEDVLDVESAARAWLTKRYGDADRSFTILDFAASGRADAPGDARVQDLDGCDHRHSRSWWVALAS